MRGTVRLYDKTKSYKIRRTPAYDIRTKYAVSDNNYRNMLCRTNDVVLLLFFLSTMIIIINNTANNTRVGVEKVWNNARARVY